MKAKPQKTADLQQYHQEQWLKLSQVVPSETQLNNQNKAEIPAQFDGLIACILIEHEIAANENNDSWN